MIVTSLDPAPDEAPSPGGLREREKRDKRELLFLIFRDNALRILQRVSPTLGEDASVVDALMKVFGPFIRFHGRHAELVELRYKVLTP